MIKVISFISIFLSISCFSQKTNTEHILASNNFDANEIEKIIDLVEYFESKILINKNDINNSYLSFCAQTAFRFDSIGLHIFNKTEIRSKIKNLPKSLRNEIWTTENAKAFRSCDNKEFEKPIKYKSFDINIYGKYFNFLNGVSKNDTLVKKYTQNILKSGSIPPLWSYRDLIIDHINYTTVDYSEYDYWRLITTIQYITRLEDTYRLCELSQN